MRNLIFAFLTVSCVAGISACDDSAPKKADMAMKPTPDLKPALTGCNGLLQCLRGCAQGDTNCENDCVSNATDNALTLLNDAFFVCPATAYCGPGTTTDQGPAPCTTQDLDPTNTSPLSPNCQACYSSITASQITAKCSTQIKACTNDLP